MVFKNCSWFILALNASLKSVLGPLTKGYTPIVLNIFFTRLWKAPFKPGFFAGIKSTIVALNGLSGLPIRSTALAISIAWGLSKSKADFTLPLTALTTGIKPKAPPVHNSSSLPALTILINILSAKGSFLSWLSVKLAKSLEVAPM